MSVQTPGFPYSERWGQNRLNDWQQPENWGYERDHYHHDATQVAMSSRSRSVGFGKVMFAAGVSNKGRGPRYFPNGENTKMEDFYECGKHGKGSAASLLKDPTAVSKVYFWLGNRWEQTESKEGHGYRWAIALAVGR